MNMQEYLAIKAVSAGVLKTLLDECPRKAWHVSPFNPNPPPPEDTDASDKGSIIHSLLLGSSEAVQVFDPADFPNMKGGGVASGWSNKAIREARDAARLAGKIPILKDDYAAVQGAVTSAHSFIASLAQTEPAVFQAFRPEGGYSESTLQWDDGGVPCKIRPDRISAAGDVMIHVKTTKGTAEPDTWGRTQLIGAGLYLWAAFYQRGGDTLNRNMPAQVFLVGEQDPPHLWSLVGVDPAMLDLGHQKIDAALRMWRECVRRNQFPGYPARTCFPELPPWESAKWLEREVQDLSLGSQP